MTPGEMSKHQQRYQRKKAAHETLKSTRAQNEQMNIELMKDVSRLTRNHNILEQYIQNHLCSKSSQSGNCNLNVPQTNYTIPGHTHEEKSVPSLQYSNNVDNSTFTQLESVNSRFDDPYSALTDALNYGTALFLKPGEDTSLINQYIPTIEVPPPNPQDSLGEQMLTPGHISNDRMDPEAFLPLRVPNAPLSQVPLFDPDIRFDVSPQVDISAKNPSSQTFSMSANIPDQDYEHDPLLDMMPLLNMMELPHMDWFLH